MLSLLLMVALLPPTTSAQSSSGNSNSTSSPYSHYGFGTLSGNSFGRGEAMGGIGIGIRNGFQINTTNPASYTAIDSMTFLMEFGINSRHTTYSTETSKNGSNNANFNHITFAVPVNRWWATSLGLLPFSSKGYGISMTNGNSTDTEVDMTTTTSTFEGNGSFSKVYWGNAFLLGKNLSIGFNTWFLFGKVSDATYVYYPYDSNAYDYLKDNNLNIHDVGITAGIQYQIETKKNHKLVLGATFEPKNKISSNYVIHEERVLFRGSSTQSPVIDTLQHVESDQKGLRLPVSYGGGFSYSIKNKITFGADYFHQKWNQALFLGEVQQYMTNSNRYSAGMEVIPDPLSIRSYWERVQYRLGGFYENSYLTLNNEQINGYGLTLGLSLPIARSRSTLNISAELGQLGTTRNDLIRERYAKFTMYVLIHDRWFIKRKFD